MASRSETQNSGTQSSGTFNPQSDTCTLEAGYPEDKLIVYLCNQFGCAQAVGRSEGFIGLNHDEFHNLQRHTRNHNIFHKLELVTSDALPWILVFTAILSEREASQRSLPVCSRGFY